MSKAKHHMIEDPWGNIWQVATHQEDVTPGHAETDGGADEGLRAD